jgi:hypothetical protein
VRERARERARALAKRGRRERKRARAGVTWREAGRRRGEERGGEGRGGEERQMPLQEGGTRWRPVRKEVRKRLTFFFMSTGELHHERERALLGTIQELRIAVPLLRPRPLPFLRFSVHDRSPFSVHDRPPSTSFPWVVAFLRSIAALRDSVNFFFVTPPFTLCGGWRL